MGTRVSPVSALTADMGSSPRVWGQGCIEIRPCGRIRIIPTRMGTSVPRSRHKRRTQDHPHAYGDKPLFRSRTPLGVGSSPRVWGQAQKFAPSQQWVRITPTRMGTSLDKWQGVITEEDHPHAYGDKLYGDEFEFKPEGSSPRVWGQVCRKRCGCSRSRIIPTRMGTRQLQP